MLSSRLGAIPPIPRSRSTSQLATSSANPTAISFTGWPPAACLCRGGRGGYRLPPFVIEGARYVVSGGGLEIRGHLDLTNPLHERGTPRMEPAAGRRVQQARGLPGRDFLHARRVLRVWIGNRREQGLGVRVARGPQKLTTGGLLHDQPPAAAAGSPRARRRPAWSPARQPRSALARGSSRGRRRGAAAARR